MGRRNRDDLKAALPDIPPKTVEKAVLRGVKAGWLMEAAGGVISLP
jgi:hypothetical protein